MGRDSSSPAAAARSRQVSIHAPTWGATEKIVIIPVKRGVSIHAPTWGATINKVMYNGISCFNPRAHVGRDVARQHPPQQHPGFNPRAHVGRDAEASAAKPHPKVSIHAPTWGATMCAPRGRSPGSVSIHAPTWGATQLCRQINTAQQFQSTRPRGARHETPA